jgi:hypothetical protein
MRNWLVVAAIMLVSLTAHAGKEERELMKNEVVPAVKKAETEFKKACGCALKITVTESIKSMDEMRQAKNTSEAIADGAPKHCTDDASKKAMCQLKSVEIKKGEKSEFTFKNGKGVVTTEGQSYVHWDMITREVDK